jgi:hypothetical protein
VARVLWLSSVVLAAVSCTQILGIGDPALVPPAGGGGGSGGEPVTTTGGTGGAGGDMGPGPCYPSDPVCNTFPGNCVALADNTDADVLGFRLQQVAFWKPDAFTPGSPEYAVLTQSLTLNLDECYLQGGGTINLIVEIDTTQSTARVGAARYAADPFDGYSFVDEVVEVDTGVSSAWRRRSPASPSRRKASSLRATSTT